MERVIVFGLGYFGKKYINDCPNSVEIIAIVDNNASLWGNTINGHKVIPPRYIIDLDFEYVVIALNNDMETYYEKICPIKKQLLDMGIPYEKIMLGEFQYNGFMTLARVEFIYSLAKMFKYYNVTGAIAECGVYRGSFACKMNKCFPQSKLYLFDTFSGFDERDIECESETMDKKTILMINSNLVQTNLDIIKLKMPYKDKIVIHQGYIPDTFKQIENERFCFVNLDMDLYQPTLAGLRFFADRMVDGGVILVHDYFVEKGNDWGARKAVDDFYKERQIVILPIGDKLSVAIKIIS